ncbi:MAG: YggS family pyridoxal phosphate-dependent enzyme [Bacteroidales bacterium]|nr:YggS family pyridoxal phosphate-dependent enzyme [Bacteroidales bacterium]
MSSISETINSINKELPSGVRLVAVSKFHPVEALKEAYEAGQRIFAESRPQEFSAKVPQMPSDVQWHFIGHLQTNKLKMVLPYAHLIQSVDSVHLLEEIQKWCAVNGKVQNVLLELHLGAEETKTGLSEQEVLEVLSDTSKFKNICFNGLMGMATNTDDESVIEADFARIEALKKKIDQIHPELTDFKELSIGMSDDYPIALRHGATFIRVGTKIFGARQY